MTTATATGRLPLGVYVDDDPDDEPTIWLHVAGRAQAPIAIATREQLERSGVKILWTYLAEHLPSRGDCRVECPCCGGSGEQGYEPAGWWHGSGVFTTTWTCGACAGDGDVRLSDTEQPDWCDQCGTSVRCARCDG